LPRLLHLPVAPLSQTWVAPCLHPSAAPATYTSGRPCRTSFRCAGDLSFGLPRLSDPFSATWEFSFELPRFFAPPVAPAMSLRFPGCCIFRLVPAVSHRVAPTLRSSGCTDGWLSESPRRSHPSVCRRLKVRVTSNLLFLRRCHLCVFESPRILHGRPGR
jgi:hypothetical protein